MKDLPREPRRPTPTAGHLVPVPFHKAIYPAVGSQVACDPVICVVAAKGLIEPADLILNRPVPNIAHELPETGHSAAKSRLLRLSANLVVAVAIARAVVGKAQKRERLWALALHAGLPLRKSTKLHQLGLARLQGKREFTQPLAQNRLNSFSVFPKLEADYKVIDVPYQICLAPKARFDNPLKPQVQKSGRDESRRRQPVRSPAPGSAFAPTPHRVGMAS